MADTALMPIPGPIDPVPVARDITPRDDGRVDLIGLPRKRIAELFEAAGLDPKQAKLRAKQVFHWLYHRGVTEFEAMTDIAKTMRPWLAERFVIGRPEVVEAQHSTDGTRKWLLRTPDGTISRWCSFPTPTAARCAFRARSAARSTARSATPALCGWCAT
jgi:23S rRNA (adenine2503-C2)-methyltransferase